jgi:hypothetical protein
MPEQGEITSHFDAYHVLRGLRRVKRLTDELMIRRIRRFASAVRVAKSPRWLAEEPRWPFPPTWEPPPQLFNWERSCPLDLGPRCFPPIAGRGRGHPMRIAERPTPR